MVSEPTSRKPVWHTVVHVSIGGRVDEHAIPVDRPLQSTPDSKPIRRRIGELYDVDPEDLTLLPLYKEQGEQYESFVSDDPIHRAIKRKRLDPSGGSNLEERLARLEANDAKQDRVISGLEEENRSLKEENRDLKAFRTRSVKQTKPLVLCASVFLLASLTETLKGKPEDNTFGGLRSELESQLDSSSKNSPLAKFFRLRPIARKYLTARNVRKIFAEVKVDERNLAAHPNGDPTLLLSQLFELEEVEWKSGSGVDNGNIALVIRLLLSASDPKEASTWFDQLHSDPEQYRPLTLEQLQRFQPVLQHLDWWKEREVQESGEYHA